MVYSLLITEDAAEGEGARIALIEEAFSPARPYPNVNRAHTDTLVDHVTKIGLPLQGDIISYDTCSRALL